jgi:hypothetical protein
MLLLTATLMIVDSVTLVSLIFPPIALRVVLGSLIAQVAIAPFYSSAITWLYFDMRVRKESVRKETIEASLPPPRSDAVKGGATAAQGKEARSDSPAQVADATATDVVGGVPAPA